MACDSYIHLLIFKGNQRKRTKLKKKSKYFNKYNEKNVKIEYIYVTVSPII